MKRTELIFNLVSIPVDAASLLLAGVVSFYFREKSTGLVGPIIFQLDLHQFLLLAYRVIPFVLVIFAFLGLYNLRGTRKFAYELAKIVEGASFGLLLVILLFFFRQSIFPSRFIVLAAWALGIFFVIVGRLLLKYVQRLLFFRNIGLHKLVIIGGKDKNLGVIEEVFKNRVFGYKVTGDLEYSGQIFAQLEEFYKEGKIDEILQADPRLKDEDNLQLVQFARNKGLLFSFVPNLFEVQRNTIETYSLNGIPVISLKNTPLDGWGKVAKRITDVILSLFSLVVTSPLFLIIACAVKIDSRGKVMYVAVRGGKDKDFECLKFRSMYNHLSIGDGYGGIQAEQFRKELWKKNDRGGESGPFLKIKHDPRVTPVGRFLRKTKLDELPQFWNVLVGDMSLIGPRAHVLDEVEKYKNRYQRMFSIKPGIFGMSQLAQVSRPTLPFEEEIKLNTYYIENWSLWLDIKILAKSFILLFFGSTSKEDY